MIYLADHILGVEYDTKSRIVITDGSTSDTNRNHCTARGLITRDTFPPQMQRTTLKVRMSTGKILSDSAQVLPCALEELGCETTSLDLYAYIWDYPDNYDLSVLRTEEVSMVKQGTKYYIISGRIQQRNLYSKLKTILKNIVESLRLFTLLTTIHFM